MQLVLFPNTARQRKVSVSNAGATIGSAADCTIVLPRENVAEYHARLQYSNGQWFILDITRRGDVSVDGETKSRLPLKIGNKISVAGNDMLVTSLEPDEKNYIPKPFEHNGAEIVHDLTVTKQCPQCGFLSHENSHFCPRCGYGFNSEITIAPAQQRQAPQHHESTITPWLALVLSVCGPIVLGIGWLIGGIVSIVYLSRSENVSRPGRRTAWLALLFSIVWLAVCGAAVGWYFWNYFSDIRIVKNEARVENLLRKIAAAEYFTKHAEIYDDDNDGIGEYVALPKLQNANYQQLDVNLKKSPLHYGYFFIIKRADEAGFICTAYPRKYGISGKKSFWIDESGYIFKKDIKGRNFEKLPKSTKKQTQPSIFETISDELAADLEAAAEAAFKKGQYEKCKRIIHNVRTKFPNTLAAKRLTKLEKSTDPFIVEFKSKELYQRAEALINKKQNDAAILVLRQIVQNYKNSSLASKAKKKLAELTEARATEFLNLAKKYVAEKQAEKALKILKNIGKKYPEASSTSSLKEYIGACETEVMKILEKKAEKLLRQGESFEAEGDYEKAYNVYLSLKNIYGKTQVAKSIDSTLDKIRKLMEEREASRLIEELFQLDPENDSSRITSLLDLLKRGYARTEIYKKNLDELNDLRKTSHANEFVKAAIQQLSNGTYRSALANFELAIEEDPSIELTMRDELELCYHALGDAAYESQDYPQALNYFKQYLKLQPKINKLNVDKLMECYFHSAKLKIQNEEYKEAEQDLIACAQKFGHTPEYNFLYGRTLMNLGYWDGAGQHFSKVLADGNSKFVEEAKIYKAYCMYMYAVEEEQVLYLTLAQDKDITKLIKDYEILFDTNKRKEIPVKTKSPLVKPASGPSFADLSLDLCKLFDSLSVASERLTGYSKNQKAQKLAERTKIRTMLQELPTRLKILRASASADAYRKDKIMEQLEKVRKLYYSVYQLLYQSSNNQRNPEKAKFIAELSEKTKLLRDAKDSFELYTGLEEQRRRNIISILENVISSMKDSTVNASPLKRDANEIRELYSSPRQTELAVETLRNLSEAYAIAPPMFGVMLSEPATTDATTPNVKK